MGWNSKMMRGVKTLGGLLLLSTAFLVPGKSAQAQLPGDDCATVAADCYSGLCNAYLCLYVGYGTNVGGSIGLISTPNSISDPGSGNFGNYLLRQALLVPPDANGIITPFYGSWLFVRVDGGAGGLAAISGTATGTSSSGGDYIFGDPRTGVWLQAPRIVGNHIEARWQTVAHAVDAAGGGYNATYDPQIEIDLVATFVHDTVRFQFDVINNSAGQTHTVGLAFIQDINSQTGLGFGRGDGPLRVSNQPYLHHEALLSGGQVPDRWETAAEITAATATSPAVLHTIRGQLKPTSSSQAEPTTPSRFAFGRTSTLNGFYILNGAKVRNFDQVWNFQPNANVILDSTSAQSVDGSTCVYWDEQVVAPGQDVKRVTFVGNADTENDFGSPMALAVTGPSALSFTTDRTTTPATVSATPSPFQISAYVQNLTDLTQSGGLAIGPVNFFLDLPKGLVLANGDSATKTLTNVGAGGEGSVSWTVAVDPTAKVNGQLRYTVTASPNLGNGKSVQKTIEIPSPPALTLLGNTTTQGLFKMVSFPLLFGSATPSEILGLPNAPNPVIDVVRYNPTTAHYESQNTFAIGSAYWVRSQQAADASYVIDATKYPPLENQVQPGASTLKINYPQGWNQIGNPYVYGFKFSELQVFDTDSLSLTDIVSASDTLHQWVLPAVYRYDTSATSPSQWHYVLEDNFGFVMVPYEGYWLLVKKPNLQFIYPGTDTPGGQVTRAALIGAGIGVRAAKTTLDNWKLQLTARNNMSTDIANVGVAPKATNSEDNFKYAKPPVIGNTVQLNIVHTDWKAGTLMQDMRAPGNAPQTWDLEVKSPKANETVTLSWADLARSVPRNYRLTLVDKDTNTRRALQNNASYTLNTGTTGTRQLQLVATPTTRSSSVLITGFNIVQNGLSRASNANTSVSINYTLTQDVETQITVRDNSGRLVRTLNPTRSASAGTGQAVWDMRDKTGSKITTGTYQIELSAIGPDGQRARQIKPFVIDR